MNQTLKFPTDGHDHEHDLSPHMNEKFFGHASSPGNMGALENANGHATGVGTCGDSITVYLSVSEQKISGIRHVPNGCVYTVACASAMSKLADGKTLDQALNLTPQDVAEELGGLPEDHLHCASLAINTLGEAIDDYYQHQWGMRN